MSRISDLAGFTTALSSTEDLSVGVITASSFSGNLTGDVTGTADLASGLTGTPSISVFEVNATGNLVVGGGVTISGDLTVQGTETIINTTELNVEDKLVGIASTATPTSTTQNNAGIQIYGERDVTITYQQDKSAVGINTNLAISGITSTNAIRGVSDVVAPGGSTVTYQVRVATQDGSHRYNGQGSGNKYVIENYQGPFITVTPGRTYRFDQSDSSNSGHPLRFYYQADKTTQYSDNVTVSGTPGTDGYTEITITDTTPVVLHYQCTAHALMGNAIQTNANPIVGAGITLSADGGGIDVTGIVTATSFSGSGENLTNLPASGDSNDITASLFI